MIGYNLRTKQTPPEGVTVNKVCIICCISYHLTSITVTHKNDRIKFGKITCALGRKDFGSISMDSINDKFITNISLLLASTMNCMHVKLECKCSTCQCYAAH